MKSSLLILTIAAAAAFGPRAQADPAGFPYSPNTNAATWVEMTETYDAFRTLYSGVVERIFMVGTNNVAPLNHVEAFPIWVSNTPSIYTYAIQGTNYSTTNWTPVLTSATVTNCLGPFAYTVGGNSLTGFAPISSAFLGAIDAKIAEVAPYFLCTNEMTDGTFEAYMDEAAEKGVLSFGGGGERRVRVPFESVGGIFARHGIGVVTNTTTNATGFITGGTYYWTRVETNSPTLNIIGRTAAFPRFVATGFPDEGFNDSYEWNTYSVARGLFATADGDFHLYPSEDSSWHLGDFWASYFQGPGTYFTKARSGPATNKWFETIGGIPVWVTNGQVVASAYWKRTAARSEDPVYGAGYWPYSARIYRTAPLVHYTRATNVFESLTVVVSGQKWQGTNSSPALGITSAETVSVSSAWTPLTNTWINLTDLTVTGAVALGDCVEVVYTNAALYGDLSPTLTKIAIDERIKVLKPLVVTYSIYSWPSGVGLQTKGLPTVWTNTLSPSLYYDYVLKNEASYGSMIDQIQAGWGTTNPASFESDRGVAFETQWHKDYSFIGIAHKSTRKVHSQGYTERLSKVCDLYLYAHVSGSPETPELSVFDCPIENAVRDKMRLIESRDLGTGTSLIFPESGSWGDLDAPSDEDFIAYEAESESSWHSKGFIIDRDLVIVTKWTPSW
jgi:hypothetical protein